MTPQDWKDEERDIGYRVVINDEGLVSIWPADRENPPGWRDEGARGSKEACLKHVGETWTDMRPASLRNQAPA